MIAGVALLTLSACCAHRANPSGRAEFHDGNDPVRLKGAQYVDVSGNTVTLSLDEKTAKGDVPPVQVKDAKGNDVKLSKKYTMSDIRLCPPKSDKDSSASVIKAANDDCQEADSATEGTILKFGKASCTCVIINKHLWCYGDTCRL